MAHAVLCGFKHQILQHKTRDWVETANKIITCRGQAIDLLYDCFYSAVPGRSHGSVQVIYSPVLRSLSESLDSS